jgi:proprotein convertase subtilisin/kexin type 5
LDNNACSKCDASCLACSGTATSCTACGSGLYLELASSSCLSPLAASCRGVSNFDPCDCVSGCPSGRGYKGICCEPCSKYDPYCVACTAANNCSECASGSIKKQNSSTNLYSCLPCQTGCATCVDNGTTTACTDCNAGYVLKNGLCYSCDSVCDVACVNNQCSSCTNGWVSAQLECVPCNPTTCLTCQGTPDYCTSCLSESHVLQGGTCQTSNSRFVS